jgi:hypothetical protein
MLDHINRLLIVSKTEVLAETVSAKRFHDPGDNVRRLCVQEWSSGVVLVSR